MTPKIRKLCGFEEKLPLEAGPLPTPFRQVAALFRNPWLGLGPDADLSAQTRWE